MVAGTTDRALSKASHGVSGLNNTYASKAFSRALCFRPSVIGVFQAGLDADEGPPACLVKLVVDLGIQQHFLSLIVICNISCKSVSSASDVDEITESGLVLAVLRLCHLNDAARGTGRSNSALY